MSKEEEEEALDPLAAIIRRKNPDGTNRFTYEEVRHWIPLLILSMEHGPAGPDPDSAELFAELVDKVAASDGETGPVTMERINRYYELHPVNPELQADLSKLAQGLVLQRQDEVRERLASLLGASSRFEERKPPAEGQVRAGPLARFATSTVKPRR